MCGICGELRFDGTQADSMVLERMNANLARRGPDCGGQYQREAVALGHRRLAIIDLSEYAKQPGTSADIASGVYIITNGL
ncbi:hypothetical protein TI03_05990 [Achromatium sp. WMS1]|nr:hypothetical protein TI03_05990 [Achromatium sp. WMS1]